MKKLLLTFICLIFPLAAFAQPASEIEIIFDASGSMNEMSGNVTKLEAAQNALTTIAKQIDANAKVGLRVFGQYPVKENKNLSCIDSKLVIPIQSFQKELMVQTVVNLEARGQTPIGYSLQQAAQDFSPDSKKTIILISDGQESCGMDPVTVMQQLKAQGIEIIVHTIGFDVNPEAEAQLRKIAEISGGMYATATSAGDLLATLQTVAQKAELLLKPEKEAGKNILAAGEGTRIISSSNQEFAKLIDGKEEQTEALYAGQYAVFAFKNNQLVLLESFSWPIWGASKYHAKELYLYSSLTSPDSGFRHIATLKPKNELLYDNIYQEFKIEPQVAARYLKVVIGPDMADDRHSYHHEWVLKGRYLTPAEETQYIQEFNARDFNMLAAEFGGKLIAAANPDFQKAIDSTILGYGGYGMLQGEGIFGFAEGKTALIKKFTVLIPSIHERNVKTIEFYGSTSSPTSGYEKLGTFETMNLIFTENPYQEFVLDQPTPVKYLKIKVIDSHGGQTNNIFVYEIQAIGILQD